MTSPTFDSFRPLSGLGGHTQSADDLDIAYAAIVSVPSRGWGVIPFKLNMVKELEEMGDGFRPLSGLGGHTLWRTCGRSFTVSSTSFRPLSGLGGHTPY